MALYDRGAHTLPILALNMDIGRARSGPRGFNRTGGVEQMDNSGTLG